MFDSDQSNARSIPKTWPAGAEATTLPPDVTLKFKKKYCFHHEFITGVQYRGSPPGALTTRCFYSERRPQGSLGFYSYDYLVESHVILGVFLRFRRGSSCVWAKGNHRSSVNAAGELEKTGKNKQTNSIKRDSKTPPGCLCSSSGIISNVCMKETLGTKTLSWIILALIRS